MHLGYLRTYTQVLSNFFCVEAFYGQAMFLYQHPVPQTIPITPFPPNNFDTEEEQKSLLPSIIFFQDALLYDSYDIVIVNKLGSVHENKLQGMFCITRKGNLVAVVRQA
jgi:hypothetical protein